MSELKITIEQLKNYLGTGLKLLPDGKSAAEKDVLIGIYQDPCLSRDLVYFGTIDGQDMRTIQEMEPICYRLSDLDKHIPELGFVPAMRIRELIKEIDGSHRGFDYRQGVMIDGSYCGPMALPYWIVKQLFQWHFWPFGDEYFEAGLVIDKLKINS